MIIKEKRFSLVLLAAGLLLVAAGLIHTRAGAQEPAQSISLHPAGGGGPGRMPAIFTYQGYLEDDGAPVTGSCDFGFELFDSFDGPTPFPGSATTVEGVDVVDGLFSTSLTFPQDLYDGQMLYLEVAVRCPAGSGSYTTLGRELLTASPYAIGLVPGLKMEANLGGSLVSITNTNTNTTLGSAIRASAASDTAPAIAAYHTGTGHALYGSSNSVYPTIGGVNNGTGVAVDARSSEGHALLAKTEGNDHYGVVGLQAPYTVDSVSSLFESGGYFAGRNGAIGYTEEAGGWGLVGWNASTVGSSNYGLYVRSNSSSSYAAYIYGTQYGLYVRSAENQTGLRVGNGNLVVDGTKSSVAATGEGERLLYAEESTEIWFSDYGFGQLTEGKAAVAIDPLFAQTVDLEQPYHVFVQPYGDAELYVTERSAGGFEVHVREGDPTVEFSYRIVAHRAGYEGQRLEAAPAKPAAPEMQGGGQ